MEQDLIALAKEGGMEKLVTPVSSASPEVAPSSPSPPSPVQETVGKVDSPKPASPASPSPKAPSPSVVNNSPADTAPVVEEDAVDTSETVENNDEDIDDLDILADSQEEETGQNDADVPPPAPSTQEINLDDLDLDDD